MANEEERLDRRGELFWVYRLTDAPLSPVTLPPRVEPASADTLNEVYRELLCLLKLSDEHRVHLLQRGLSEATTQRLAFRTLPLEGRAAIASRMFRVHGDACAGVPGWFLRDGRPNLAGAPGILIPVPDLEGRVVAIKIRADAPAEPSSRYSWMSSAKFGGPGARNTAYPCAPPGFRRLQPGERLEVLRLTEGELKAAVAAELSGVLTVSVPGATNFECALPLLRALTPRRVLLAFDADWRTNRRVALAFVRCYDTLRAQGFDVEPEFWAPEMGKGIDDYLLNARRLAESEAA